MEMPSRGTVRFSSKPLGGSPWSVSLAAVHLRATKEIMMKRLLLASAMLGAMAFAGTASAQNPLDFSQPPVGKQAGTLTIRVRAIGVVPLDADSSVSVIGGHVSTSAQPAPELDISWFFTDNIAVELIAATTRHTLTATGTSLGNVDVGSTWVLPPTLTLQYHFMPHEQLSPYVGVGLNASFSYSTKPFRKYP